MPIRRADRLFDILRILRSAKAPVTAASIADELEVTSFQWEIHRAWRKPNIRSEPAVFHPAPGGRRDDLRRDFRAATAAPSGSLPGG